MSETSIGSSPQWNPAARRRAGSSVGEPATRIPAASSAATLPAAVPAAAAR